MRYNYAGFLMYLSFPLLDWGRGGEGWSGGEKQTPLNKCKKQKALDKNKQFHTHYVSPGLLLAATNSVSSQ